ncbi:MAG: hypothetical protein WD577_09985 [Bacteroidales bacterium]
MSYSKISSITLIVVAVISLVVILFFYSSPRTVDIIELEARIEQLLTEGALPGEPEPGVAADVDTTAVDSVTADNLETTEDGTAEEVMDEDSAAIIADLEEEIPVPDVIVEEVDLKDYLSNWEYMVYKRTDYALGWAYFLLLIAAVAALTFPLITIVTDVKAILRLLMVVGAAAVLLLVSYFVFASDTPINILGYTGTDNTNPVTLKWIGTGLFSTYIIFGIAFLSILYFEVVSIFK